MTSKSGRGGAFASAARTRFQPGMSLRQYIIIELVAAQISHEGIHTAGYEKTHLDTANRYADIMIAEGEK